MLIDWFTVGAQALNFIILVGLLKHFLYRPVLDAIDVRDRQIGADVESAAAQKLASKSEREQLQSKNKAFDEERAALLSRATEDGKAVHASLLQSVQREAQDLRIQQTDALRAEQLSVSQELGRLAEDEVFGIARRALADLSNTALEERIVEVFTHRLRNMDVKAKAEMGDSLRSASQAALVRTAFPLPEHVQATLQSALNEAFSADIRIRFDIEPKAICGIELSSGGRKLAWSIEDYLSSLQQKSRLFLNAKAGPDAGATAPETQGLAPIPQVAVA